MRLIVCEVIASLWRHQLNNISHLFILVQSFRYAKITRWSHKNCHFAVVEGNQMPLGVFLCVYEQEINV